MTAIRAADAAPLLMASPTWVEDALRLGYRPMLIVLADGRRHLFVGSVWINPSEDAGRVEQIQDELFDRGLYARVPDFAA